MKLVFFSKSILIFLLLLSLRPALAQGAYFPAYRESVVDAAYVLEPKTVEEIKEECRKLTSLTGTRITVVTVNTCDPLEPAEYAHTLLNDWIEKRHLLGNSVLLLFYVIEGEVRIEAGPELERILDRKTREDILIKAVFQYTAKGDFDGGALVGVKAIAKIVRDHYYGIVGSKTTGLPAIPVIFLTIIMVLFASMYLKTGLFSVLLGCMGAVFGYLYFQSVAGIIGFAIVLFVLGYFSERPKPSKKYKETGKEK